MLNKRDEISNSIQCLKSLEKKSIDLIVADPPYNIKKADWDKFETQEQYIIIFISRKESLFHPLIQKRRKSCKSQSRF